MDENTYSPEWEIVNSTLRRIRTPRGWLAVISEHVIYGGKDIHVMSYPIKVYDPNHTWIFRSKG